MSPVCSPHVAVRELRKSYDGVAVLHGVSFAIEAGEIFGLLGPNGAGKTTTVECLVGLREPESGEIAVGGIDARRRPREVKEQIGVALQATSLPDKITPCEALRLFGAMYRARVEPAELLERFALRDKAESPVDSLSGGQRQRLGLALAFVNRPRLVVLDEPTAGLDPQARRDLHAAIRRRRDDGCTVLFTTHHLDEAEELCDRVAIIDHGRLLATGTPGELVARSRAPQTVTLRTAGPLAPELLAALPGAGAPTGGGGEWCFPTSDPPATLAGLARLLAEVGAELVALQVRRASLEEVFLGLTRRRGAGEEEKE